MTKTARALFLLGVLNLVGRGTDYLFSPDPDPPEEITSLAPTVAWGVVCLLAAFLVLAGLVTSRVKLTLTGGAVAAAAYAAFAIQRFIFFISSPPFEDWREVVSLVVGVGAWSVLILSTAIRSAVIEARAKGGGCCAGLKCADSSAVG